MDSGLQLIQKPPLPLVFILGPKESQDYLIKAYNEITVPKKTTYPLTFTHSVNFISFPLNTNFYQEIQALTSKKKGLINLNWIKKYSYLVYI